MTVDPAAQSLLDLLDELGLPAIEDTTPEECRSAFEALRDPEAPVAEVQSTEDMDIDGVPCRIYTPEGEPPFPVLVWYHGGGWVIGSMDEADPTARELCSRTGCIVVNVDYRLAPEHPFPAGLEDALAVASWVADHAATFGGDPDRLAVGGDSAGGNLAAIAAQHLPGVFGFQLLVYPAVDLTFSHPSIDENGEGYLLTKAAMEWFRSHYLQGAGSVDERDPRLSPLWAEDSVFTDLPPALVITAGYDPLRDEGIAYFNKMKEAGVDVSLLHFQGQIHAFYTMFLAIPAGYEALDASAAAIQKALG